MTLAKRSYTTSSRLTSRASPTPPGVAHHLSPRLRSTRATNPNRTTSSLHVSRHVSTSTPSLAGASASSRVCAQLSPILSLVLPLGAQPPIRLTVMFRRTRRGRGRLRAVPGEAFKPSNMPPPGQRGAHNPHPTIPVEERNTVNSTLKVNRNKVNFDMEDGWELVHTDIDPLVVPATQ